MNSLYFATSRRIALSTTSVATVKIFELNATFVPGVSS